jgi:catechol 2,3-dioxygenase-like lactoylglutathione lyase family enzyme
VPAWGDGEGGAAADVDEGVDAVVVLRPDLRVEDIDAVVTGLRARGAELVGELERYEDGYRLCYVRGPEGIIIELAEQIG